MSSDGFDLASSNCKPGVAQILVQDGFLQNLCGCDQNNGVMVVPPATLNCTVPRGTTVFFHFTGNRLRHQIIPTGTQTFVPSPQINPDSDTKLRAYAITLQDLGTYPFEDGINRSMSGQLIAR